MFTADPGLGDGAAQIDRVIAADYRAYLKTWQSLGNTWRTQVQNGLTFGGVAIGLLGDYIFYWNAYDDR